MRELVLGEAKVSDLATAVGEPPNSVSFHLRQLEKYGYIQKSPGPEGTSRKESWWRITQPNLSVNPAEVCLNSDGNQASEAQGAAIRTVLADRAERLAFSIQNYDDLSDATSERSILSNEFPLRLSPEQARHVSQELKALYEKWAAVSEDNPTGERYALGIDFFPEAPVTPRVSGETIDLVGEPHTHLIDQPTHA